LGESGDYFTVARAEGPQGVLWGVDGKKTINLSKIKKTSWEKMM